MSLVLPSFLTPQHVRIHLLLWFWGYRVACLSLRITPIVEQTKAFIYPFTFQGQAGCSSGQPALEVGNTAQSRGVETRWSLRSFSAQAILWFCDWFYGLFICPSSQILRESKMFSVLSYNLSSSVLHPFIGDFPVLLVFFGGVWFQAFLIKDYWII